MLAGTGVSTRFYHILGLRSFRLRELSGLKTVAHNAVFLTLWFLLYAWAASGGTVK